MTALSYESLVKQAKTLIETLRASKAMIVTAESCTGGLISQVLTSVSGSSSVVWGAFVTYANDAKERILDVSTETLAVHGAVSEPVVRAMVSGALRQSGADVAVSVSGIAGPDGGTEEKPVGTVWLGCGRRGGSTTAVCHQFEGDREAVRRQSCRVAFDMVHEQFA